MSQSPLEEYRKEIEALAAQGYCNSDIAKEMQNYGVLTTRDSVRRAKQRWGINGVTLQVEAEKPLQSHTARILYVDIETSPNIADVWGLWDQNVGLSQIRESARIIGFGYKWKGKPVKWVSEYDPETGELSQNKHREMLRIAHDLYDQADIVVTYNGDKFDHKHFNREWVTIGITPPSPVKSVDLCRVVKQKFKFPSNKLEYVAQKLIGDTKVQHCGHQLWRDCLDPEVDPDTRRKAWKLMERYCKKDVTLMEPLHEILLPWLPASVNASLIGNPDGSLGCQKCGSLDLEARGTAYTATRAYPQYRCRNCGGWTRDSKSSWSTANRGIIGG